MVRFFKLPTSDFRLRTLHSSPFTNHQLPPPPPPKPPPEDPPPPLEELLEGELTIVELADDIVLEKDLEKLFMEE